MASAGIPVLFIWPAIALELLGSLAIFVGFRTKEISVMNVNIILSGFQNT
jgi:uncharacterized membrane protein YphA (DoxX/SURF4 family)